MPKGCRRKKQEKYLNNYWRTCKYVLAFTLYTYERDNKTIPEGLNELAVKADINFSQVLQEMYFIRIGRDA